MEKKLFVVNRLTDYCDGEREEKESMCVFYGTNKEASRIETEYGTQSCRAWRVWLEVEEVPQISNVNEVLELCGHVFPMEKTLFLHFFKEPDGIYVYKHRPDRTEEEAKPNTRKIFTVELEFANTLRSIKDHNIDKNTRRPVKWNIVVNYRRVDNIVDIEELKQIAEDVESKAKIEFRCE